MYNSRSAGSITRRRPNSIPTPIKGTRSIRFREKVKLGIINNPSSLQNHLNPWYHDRLGELVALDHSIRTANTSEVRDAVLELISTHGINVLGVNGGDGTLHGVLNALVDMLEDDTIDETLVPLLIPLNGGTYNIASRALGTKGNPVDTAKEFLKRYGEGIIDDIKVTQLPVLDLKTSDNRRIRGMVFGSEVVANALDLCAEFGSGYRGLVKLLSKGVTGALMGTSFIREQGWRFRPERPVVVVDGQEITAAAATVSTIDLTLVKGLIKAMTATIGREHFHARVIVPQDPKRLAMLLPHLLWELSAKDLLNFPRAEEVITWGAFTMDGELYPHQGQVILRPSGYAFDMVNFR